MHRISIAFVLAMVLVLAVGYAALAAQQLDPGRVLGDGDSDYLPTADGSEYVPSEGRVHSGYQKNTDACAACHSTHTGVGAALLQWADVTTTCLACHDGSVSSTYDVVAGEYTVGADVYRTPGGLFGYGMGGLEYLDIHDVSYGVTTTVGAAPGGNPAGTDDGAGNWSSEFTCASCHTPHGQGGNARILNPDPNGYAMKMKKTSFALTELTSTTYAAYVSGDSHRLGYAPGDIYTWIKGYPYSPKVYVGGVQNNGATVDNSNGYTIVRFSSPPSGAVTGTFVPAVRVAMSYGPNGSSDLMTADENITYKQGINAFCGACHMDYNTAIADTFDGAKYGGAAAELTGNYAEAYRHQVGYQWHGTVPGLKFEPNSTVVCLTCHVAHGADKGYWLDTLATADNGYWTDTTAVELDGNSVLKRKPNMGVCESCHGKSSGNDGYEANTQ